MTLSVESTRDLSDVVRHVCGPIIRIWWTSRVHPSFSPSLKDHEDPKMPNYRHEQLAQFANLLLASAQLERQTSTVSGTVRRSRNIAWVADMELPLANGSASFSLSVSRKVFEGEGDEGGLMPNDSAVRRRRVELNLT